MRHVLIRRELTYLDRCDRCVSAHCHKLRMRESKVGRTWRRRLGETGVTKTIATREKLSGAICGLKPDTFRGCGQSWLVGSLVSQHDLASDKQLEGSTLEVGRCGKLKRKGACDGGVEGCMTLLACSINVSSTKCDRPWIHSFQLQAPPESHTWRFSLCPKLVTYTLQTLLLRTLPTDSTSKLDKLGG